jgi:hypothetical protein
MFVTPKVFKSIGLSYDGQRHGRDTNLLSLQTFREFVSTIMPSEIDHWEQGAIHQFVKKNILNSDSLRDS